MAASTSSTIPNDAATGILSDNGILRSLANKTVVIAPFRRAHLNSASYDVTLGPYYFRENTKEGFLNPYHDLAAKRGWKGCTATRMADVNWTPEDADHVNPNELVIALKPGETILAHTCEFIGSTNPIVPALFARSSLERCFVHVETGFGDAGFVNRWALRITNTSKHFTIPLITGRKIAQIVFYQTEGVLRPPYGTLEQDKYQQGATLEEISTAWGPEALLPSLQKEEIGRGKLSMASDPVPRHGFTPYFLQPRSQVRATRPSSSMTNPNAASAAVQQQQQYSQQQPIHLRQATRDANGEIVSPILPTELQSLETRNLGVVPVLSGTYDPHTV